MAYTPEVGRAFWYELDRRTLYDADFMAIVSRAGATRVQNVYTQSRRDGTYPEAFIGAFRPRRSDWIILADVQTDTIRNHLADSWADIQSAFEDFGQGTLLDTAPERQETENWIHMMDVADEESPPVGYHRWHASIRVFQSLQIGDAPWWEELDRMVCLAWAIQSFARPRQQDTPNPPIDASDLQELRNAWLGLSPDRRDRQFDVTGSFGYHPSPRAPVP